MRRRDTINDDYRRKFVLSDEGLYNASRSFKGKGGVLGFVKANRAFIDEVIGNVTSGRRKEHYLVYG